MTTAYHPWGRVDADGTVYVRTADGERVIGSWQAGSPEEAIAFFARKYEALETEVSPARAADHHHRHGSRPGLGQRPAAARSTLRTPTRWGTSTGSGPGWSG